MKVTTPESFVDFCKNQMLREGRLIAHTVVAVRNGESLAAFIDMSTPNELLRPAFAAAGASMVDGFEDGGPPELIMIGRETWMSQQQEVAPSEDPNRREGLCITVLRPPIELYFLCYEVTRTGSTLDLHLLGKFGREEVQDYNLGAFVGGLLNARKGKAPKMDGLHVIQVTPGKEPVTD